LTNSYLYQVSVEDNDLTDCGQLSEQSAYLAGISVFGGTRGVHVLHNHLYFTSSPFVGNYAIYTSEGSDHTHAGTYVAGNDVYAVNGTPANGVNPYYTTAYSPQTAVNVTNSGAASTSVFTLSGTPYMAGSATTNYPLFAMWTSGATAPTTWSTAGTFLGANAPTGFTGNFIDFHVNGGVSAFSVNNVGTLTTTGSITGINSRFTFQGGVRTITVQSGTRYTVTSSDGYIYMSNTAARAVMLLQTSNAGQIYCIKDSAGTAGTANITVSVATSGTIDGAASNVIDTNYGIHCYQYQTANGVYFIVQ
jgi:hypothetical protein